MFETLNPLPADPILGLNQQYQRDESANKINLSVGVYQDENGNTPIFSAVKRAEQQMLAAQATKAYIPQQGDPAFLESMNQLIFGDELMRDMADRVATVMTPGGCGGLRMGAELLAGAGAEKRQVWVSDPTWANHFPLLQSAGLQLQTYRYYDAETGSVNIQALLDSLQQIPQGDIVLLHACCHNPTGADLSKEHWDKVIDVIAERQLLPFIDMAYQGFGDSLEEDVYGVRQAATRLPEMLLASSCSKNFGLYRERIGGITVLTESAKATDAARSHILSNARKAYSMSPFHGGGIVAEVLRDAALKQEWIQELDQVRTRMNSLRCALAEGLNAAQSVKDFSFVANSKGMFCYLGISEEQVLALRSEYSIYLLNSSRINIAGLSDGNLDTIVERVSEVVQR